MIARLHALLAYYVAKHTYRRMAERHYYAGIGYPANENPFGPALVGSHSRDCAKQRARLLGE